MKSIIFVFICALTATAAILPEEAYRQANESDQAVQHWYTEGVPHTDKNGRILMKYQAGKSFFPIAMWGVPAHVQNGEYDWGKLKDLHINTVWPMANFISPSASLKVANRLGYQVILMHRLDDNTLKAIKNHPCLLGNVWMDEPIGHVERPGKMEKLMAQFKAYKSRIHALAPDLPIFINDAPWIMPPATEWFCRWNTAGDVACHDNYPIKISSSNVPSLAAKPNSIPLSTALTTIANGQKKPVWLIIGAFEQGYPRFGEKDPFPFRYPTSEQLRAQVYLGIVHGASGIHYFIWDSFISRDGSVLGISPAPLETPAKFIANSPRALKMSPLQQAKSQALWKSVAMINEELKTLTPSLLSPTAQKSTLDYTVKRKILAGQSVVKHPIRCLLKTVPSKHQEFILLSVNTEAAAIDATFTFDRTLKDATVLFKSSQHPPVMRGNIFDLHYEPFAVHVIKIKVVKR